MIKRLRKKFIRIAMLSVTVVMLSLTLIVNTANFIFNDSSLNGMLNIISENKGSIPSRSEPKEPSSSGKKPEKIRTPFSPETPFSTRYFYIYFDENGVMEKADFSHIATVTESDADEYINTALKHGEGSGYYSGYKYRVIKYEGGKYMAIFLDCYREMNSVKTVAVLSLLADAICIGLVYILVVIFSRRAIDPVVRSAEQQKQFITDASHELKTPITVIATSLKVLEMETGKQKWIDKAMAQTEKLKELVNSLITLSRMDEDESSLKFERFSISGAVSETAESFMDFALSKQHKLNIYMEPDIEYFGDEYSIRRLVSILLDNAVKYASNGADINFSLKKPKKDIIITVSNKCDNLSQDDIPKLFDRFYRADKSRNASAGGFGIGLSIAKSIAEAHKGRISAEYEKDEIKFTAELKL